MVTRAGLQGFSIETFLDLVCQNISNYVTRKEWGNRQSLKEDLITDLMNSGRFNFTIYFMKVMTVWLRRLWKDRSSFFLVK